MTDSERERVGGLCCIIAIFGIALGLLIGFGIGTSVGNREAQHEAHKAGVGRWESNESGGAEFKYGKFEDKK